METPRELIIQDAIAKYLDYYKIFPASVLYSENAPNSVPSLNITFYSDLDLEDYLKLILYDSLCDKSGILIFNNTTTVILSGLIMSIFFREIWENLLK